jgi:hypothetical protein
MYVGLNVRLKISRESLCACIPCQALARHACLQQRLVANFGHCVRLTAVHMRTCMSSPWQAQCRQTQSMCDETDRHAQRGMAGYDWPIMGYLRFRHDCSKVCLLQRRHAQRAVGKARPLHP